MGGMMQKLVLSWSREYKMFTIGQHLWRERGRIEQGKSQTSWLATQYSLIKPLANLSQLLGSEHWPSESSPNKVTWSGFDTFTLQSLNVSSLENGLSWVRCLLEVDLVLVLFFYQLSCRYQYDHPPPSNSLYSYKKSLEPHIFLIKRNWTVPNCSLAL